MMFLFRIACVISVNLRKPTANDMQRYVTHRVLLALLAFLVACGSVIATTPAAAPPPSLPDADMSAVPARDPGSVLPADWKLGPFVEIYVRGYKDSDGDGIGDLRGLTQKLDYLKDLGVTGIWLMPVTNSQDKDHG